MGATQLRDFSVKFTLYDVLSASRTVFRRTNTIYFTSPTQATCQLRHLTLHNLDTIKTTSEVMAGQIAGSVNYSLRRDVLRFSQRLSALAHCHTALRAQRLLPALILMLGDLGQTY